MPPAIAQRGLHYATLRTIFALLCPLVIVYRDVSVCGRSGEGGQGGSREAHPSAAAGRGVPVDSSLRVALAVILAAISATYVVVLVFTLHTTTPNLVSGK